MILMYCYGSAFHVNKLRLKKHHHGAIATTIASPDETGDTAMEKVSTGKIKTHADLNNCHIGVENR